MKDCVLFVHGIYRKNDIAFYKKLCRSKTRIAVDGGHAFFKKAGIIPELLIGDMDSAFSLQEMSPKTSVLTFPARKDKTDSQLALEYCIEQGAGAIDIVQPSVGQPDHFVGNILMTMLPGVTSWARKGGRLRFVNPAHEVCFVADGEVSFKRSAGDTLSVMPLSRQITLTCTGTDYNVAGARISKGHTRGLRNRIVSGKASVAVKGEALVWHFFGK